MTFLSSLLREARGERQAPTIESENMNTKHSKGPWTNDPMQPTIWANDGETKIATIDDLPWINGKSDWITEQANAQLIAAAPELLDFAIIVSRSACLQQVNGNECICFACLAKKLVDKATK